MKLIQSWWFQLYTKPIIVSLIKNLCICVTLDVLLINYGGPFKTFALFLMAAYPATLLWVGSKGSFRSNIEFHKMNVPFPVLKKAFLTHIGLTVLAISFACMIHILFSSLLGGLFSHKAVEMLQKEFSFYEFLSVVGAFLVFLVAVMFWSKDQKYVYYQKPNNLLKNLLNFLLFLFPAFIYIGISEYLNFSEVLFFFVPMLGIFVGASLFHSRAIFHQEKPKGRRRDLIKYGGIGYAITFTFYFICVQMAKTELLDPSLDPRKRASAFSYMRGFSPEIDEELFYTVGKFISYEDSDTFHSKLNFKVSEYHSSMFTPHPLYGHSRLHSLLRSGKIDKNFLVQLYDDFENHSASWEKIPNFGHLQYQAFVLWPKNEKLPERFVAKRLGAKELYQKEQVALEAKRKEARARQLASENSDE